MSSKIFEKETDGVILSLTRFSGGTRRGLMLQVTIDEYFIQMTKNEILDMVEKIEEAFSD